ncbi:hypothetical protein ACFP2T_15370 [Plantactinospora solaniradicis]|uniref:DUF3040 domain-containing protein n=1 Tax=Plantactinospora solaniradicis TaxID=1723736 RepID=A0ABW1K719_9ACTN
MAGQSNAGSAANEPGAETADEATTSVPPDTDWRDRLERQHTDWQRRTTDRQRTRTEFAVRRNHGLAARHAARSRR